ncbi:MAG: hypothetical protein EA380_04070 [Phycisphaeraceae bacterium]|nr:MAG: hypothetical protein EA380_04070 [Phycisphaeraceae bacterium]
MAHEMMRAMVMVVGVCAVGARAGDFADVLFEYAPAPGQFINGDSNTPGEVYNDPAAALGPPIGAGATSPSNAKVVSLGGFGGSITLGFSETVWADPCNPWGVDAIVFGNAFWLGTAGTHRWAEPGVIEISRDVNGNGIPDDPWYVVRGSHLAVGPGKVPMDFWEEQDWDDDPNTATPPAQVWWYPDPLVYPGFPSSYTTAGYRLPSVFEVAVLVTPAPGEFEAYWGYADMSPTLRLGDLTGNGVVDDPSMTPEEFYTRASNPFRVGITAGSGGGDGFGISWAVDPETGERAPIDGFDFIRIRTGTNFVSGSLGEHSTEVGGVARARADRSFFDVDGSGAVDVEDVYAWHAGMTKDLTGDGTIGEADRLMLLRCVRCCEINDMTEGR